jgi:hypothetical protein
MLHVSFAGHPISPGTLVPKELTATPPVIYYPPAGAPLTYLLYDEDKHILHGFWTGNGTMAAQARLEYWPMHPPPGQTHRYTVYVLAESPDSYPVGFNGEAYRYLDSIGTLIRNFQLQSLAQLTYFSN